MGTGKNINLTRLFAYKGRVAELTVGYLGKRMVSGSFDYFLYPFVIYRLGILKGGAVMTFLSFLACIGIMKFYDWSKRDWLGIEAIKGLREYEGSRFFGRFVSWVLRQSAPVAVVLLSINFDTFIVTAYMRKGAYQFTGMNRRDWKIFLGSLIIGNAYWTLACFMGISLAEWAWKVIAGY